MKKIISLLIFSLIFFQGVWALDLESEFNNRFYSKINKFSQDLAVSLTDKLKEHENIKYFDMSVDLQQKKKPSLEIKAVNKISESSDGALFNQTSISAHDGDATINFGLGKRKLLENDTWMLGANAFLDYQLNEAHLRNGFGLEAISSIFDVRGNYYNAISGFKTTDDGREKALDGYDLQLNYHLLGKNNTDIFLNTFEWKNPNSSFLEKGEKLGITTQVGNFAYDIGYLNDNKNGDEFFGGVKLIIQLGEKKISKNNKERSGFVSVRDQLYIPVKRENKIKVVKISKSGVQVSGF